MSIRTAACLASLLAFTLVGAPTLAAQIDVAAQRQWAWLMAQRRGLLVDLTKLPAERVDSIAELLVDAKESVPCLTLARAQALARGVEADAGFLFRAGLQVLAMPEVISSDQLDSIDITITASHAGITGDLPSPKVFGFELRITDVAGAVVWRGKMKESKSFDELMRFEVTLPVPVGDLPDGLYRVHVDIILDGQAPRAHDQPVTVAFARLRDYKARAGVFFHRVEDTDAHVKGLSPVERGILAGCSRVAARPYAGLPGVDPANDVRDLQRAERVLASTRKGEPSILGHRGYFETALPLAGDSANLVSVSIRLPARGLQRGDAAATRRMAARPLVLICPRPPFYDHLRARPSAPRVAPPSFLAASLEAIGFDAERAFQVVILESAGRLKFTAEVLDRLVKDLGSLVSFDARKVVLVGDGHGAHIAADLALARHRDMVRGLVLVNSGGGLATPQLVELADLPILAIPGHKALGEESIQRLGNYAKLAGTASSVTILDKRKWPWCFAIPLAARQIESFVRDATRERAGTEKAGEKAGEKTGKLSTTTESGGAWLVWISCALLALLVVGWRRLTRA